LENPVLTSAASSVAPTLTSLVSLITQKVNLCIVSQSLVCNSAFIKMNKKEKPTDRFLILQYRSGNTAVLPTLVKRYHKVFCEKAYWITKDKELAKDIAQESWIIIINKLHTLEKVDSFKSWAFRIVYTKAIDRLKLRHLERENLASLGRIEPGHPSSEDESELIQLTLLKAIRKLPKEKQDIIRLFYAEAYSIIEISAFLNIPIGTVKSRLFKAREKLKSLLKSLKKVSHEE
jgi:RNA polymerase sigma-70 factor (ECF subfamily)